MIAQTLLREIEQESPKTRALFERIPEEKLGWKPHPKSLSLGELAQHIATIPGAIAAMAARDVADLPSFTEWPRPSSRAELLRTLEESLASAKGILSTMDDARATAEWKMQKDGQVVFSAPRDAVLRMVLLNHLYHHRGQLTVYLRLLDVPLPFVFGPTADENPFG